MQNYHAKNYHAKLLFVLTRRTEDIFSLFSSIVFHRKRMRELSKWLLEAKLRMGKFWIFLSCLQGICRPMKLWENFNRSRSWGQKSTGRKKIAGIFEIFLTTGKEISFSISVKKSWRFGDNIFMTVYWYNKFFITIENIVCTFVSTRSN